jgi:hypothetical protein
MTSYTQYKDPTDTSAGLSPAIWADCPTAEIAHAGIGYDVFDDFVGPSTPAVTGTVGAIAEWGNYSIFGSSGATIADAGVAGGAIVLTEATDGESVSIYQESRPWSITANAGKLWFEARIKVAGIVTLAHTHFIGLIDSTAVTAIVPITAGGVLADLNCVGWFYPEADTTTQDFTYKADGVTAVQINNGVGTLAADTYIKLGFVFDPTPSTTGTANQLVGYINGAQQATPKTIPDNTGTDFPADVRLGFCATLAVGAGTDTDTLTMDWWRCAQLRTT